MNEILNPLEGLKEEMRQVYEREKANSLAGVSDTVHFLNVPGLDDGEAEFDPSDLTDEDLGIYNAAKSGNMSITEFRNYIKPLAGEFSRAKAENNAEFRKAVHSRYCFAQYVANIFKFKQQ